MAKTKEIVFTASGGQIRGQSGAVRIVAYDTNIETVLTNLDKEDIAPWLDRNFKPEEIFQPIALRRWAEANGYIKGDQP